jgi:hypothetical protein
MRAGGQLPRWCRSLRFGQIPSLHAVVHVAITGGAERGVVEAVGANGKLQFFAELMNRPQMIGGGGHFELAGLEKLLEAAIEQAGQFASEQVARIHDKLDSTFGVSPHNRCAAVLLHLELASDPRNLANIKLRGAEGAENFIECAGLAFLWHSEINQIAGNRAAAVHWRWRAPYVSLSHIGK